MRPRFLLDENLDPEIGAAARRLEPAIDIVSVGKQSGLALGTLDPVVLSWCEGERRILITNNRHSMPGHIADHLREGHHHWGVFNSRESNPDIGLLADAIYLV
jgi:hypothetical protein